MKGIDSASSEANAAEEEEPEAGTQRQVRECDSRAERPPARTHSTRRVGDGNAALLPPGFRTALMFFMPLPFVFGLFIFFCR